MVICLLKIVPLPDKWDAVFEILQSVINLSRGRPGCISCATYEEHNKQHSLLYVEQWESQEDLNRHIQSSFYHRIFNAMDLAGEAPEIFFHEVSKTTGMDFVKALRTMGEQNG